MKVEKGNYCGRAFINMQIYRECYEPKEPNQGSPNSPRSSGIFIILRILSVFLPFNLFFFFIFTAASVNQPDSPVILWLNIFVAITLSVMTLNILVHVRPQEFGLPPKA